MAKSKKDKYTFQQGYSEQFGDILKVTEENVGINAHSESITISIDKIIIQNNPRKLAISPADIMNGIKDSDPQLERKKNEIKSLHGLKETISKHGLLHEIHVYKEGKKYVLLVGQRRTLSSLLAGKSSIKARVWDVKPEEETIQAIQWVENIHRENLTPLDALMSARGLIDLYKRNNRKEQVSVGEISKILLCSRGWAHAFYGLLSLHADVHDALRNNLITSLEKASLINKIGDDEKRKAIIKELQDGVEISIKTLTDYNKNEKKQAGGEVQEAKSGKNVRRGRVTTKVSFGTTKNKAVARKIVTAILNAEGSSELEKNIQDIDWQHYDSINRAFKTLMTYLEKNSGE